jgi:sigma-54 dependent transcriptional regulator, acetoin dehydrogenase operon transcriptional activator AcoR
MGTALTNAEGRIIFISEVARQQFFGGRGRDVLDQRWQRAFPFSAEDYTQLKSMARKLPDKRKKVIARVEGLGGQNRWIDVEVLDDPRDPQRKIFLFFDGSEMHDLRRQIDEKTQFYDLVGRSKAMGLVYQQIREVANADWTVLIQGETGTGKELVARALHSTSHRSDKPFLALNCAGLTDTLVGSQLFGHVRGAFTGAISDH